MDGDATHLGTHQFAFAGVKAGANLKPEWLNGIHDGTGALHGAGGPVEGGEEAVAGGINLAPAEANEVAPHRGVMAVQKLTPAAVAQASGFRRGTDDVGKEHRGKHAVRFVEGPDAGEELGRAHARFDRWTQVGAGREEPVIGIDTGRPAYRERYY